MKKQRLHILATIAIALAVLALVSQTLARKTSAFSKLDVLVDVRHEIVTEFVETPDQEKMNDAAVRAMIQTLNDPYTAFISPEELEPFDKAITGTFSGIGAEVDLYENRLRIVSPLDDSPAWKSGVLAGDLVLEIDGKTTEGLSLPECIKRLTGPEGTKVTLKVRHESGEEAAITITRAQITVQTVRGWRRDADHKWDFMLDPATRIGYVRLSQFTGKTAEDLRAALDQLKQKDARGLILDLRFNPGGLLDSAIAVSDLFLEGGKRIVSVKGRSVPERVTMATDKGTIPPIPVVVLANEGSASAAEIVTGALADNGRAKFIGTRTFGKGSVQQVKMLESGSGAIKLTNAYYYLPNGRNIHRRTGKDEWGVDPDDGFWVPMTTEQVRAMVKVRHDSDVLHQKEAAATQPATPQWIEKELADPQLAAGLKALLGKLAGGDWPKVGQSGAAQLAKESRRTNLMKAREQLSERLEQVDKELANIDQPATRPATQPAK